MRAHLARRGLAAEVLPHPDFPDAPVNRLRFAVPDPAPRLSVLIPTRDRPDLLSRCVAALRRTDWPDLEILIADNGSERPETLDLLRRLAADTPGLRVLPRPGPFNYARLCNDMAAEATGEVLTLMNDDAEPLDPGWARETVPLALRPDIGCVGARLLFPDGSLQHAGVVLGVGHGAEHMPALLPPGEPGHFARALPHRRVAAVTGAVLTIRRTLYAELGGLDAEHLPVTSNDIDLCLKASAAGLANLHAPHAVFRHLQSASRGPDDTPEKRAAFAAANALMDRRWGLGAWSDPHYSPHLSDAYPGYAPARTPRSLAPRLGLPPQRRR